MYTVNHRKAKKLICMKYFIPLINQLYQLWRTLVISITLGLLGIVGVYALSQIKGMPLSDLTRDPAAVTDTSVYIGILSTLGILLWSATTAICLFAAALLSRDRRHRQASWFLLCSGLLCLLLTFDDALLLHERVFPYLLNIPQFGVVVGYALIVGVYLLYFVRRILTTDYLLLLLALLFLSSSAAMDQFLSVSKWGGLETFFEDSLKFIGIVFWLAYFAHAATINVRLLK